MKPTGCGVSTNHQTELSTTDISLQEARVVFERMREFTELTPEFNSRQTQMTSMGQSPENRL